MPSAMRLVLILSLLLLPVLAGCGKEPARPGEPAEPPTVQGVTVGVVEPTEIADATEVTGTVRSQTVTAVSSQTMGRILAFPVREGSVVEPGQLLVELDDRDIAAQRTRAEAAVAEAQAAAAEVERAIAASAAAQVSAEAQRDLAASTLARYRALLERKAVAPQEYDQVAARDKAAVAEVERAIAERQAVQARRGQLLARIDSARAEIGSIAVLQSYARITAHRAGRVTQKLAEVGAMASPGMPLLQLEDHRRYWLEVAVPESRLAGIRPGSSLAVAVEAAGIAATAAVREIVPAADPATRTTLVRLDLPASTRLRAGLFGRARIPVGRRQALQIARQAVVERGQLQGVYVVGADRIARFRLIRTGPERQGQVEVLSGLSGGEIIALAGVERLSDGARVQP